MTQGTEASLEVLFFFNLFAVWSGIARGDLV